MSRAPITVLVDGREYETIIHENGTQRFPQVPGLHEILCTDTGISRRPVRTPNPVPPNVIDLAKTNEAVAWVVKNNPCDLNEMEVAYQRRAFPQLDYAEFKMAIGYSVSGWCELSAFLDMSVINPLWEPAVALLWAFGERVAS